MTQPTVFKHFDQSLTVYAYGNALVGITAAMGSNRYADATLPKEDAPAFALAVLEAAGYTSGQEGCVPSRVERAVISLNAHLREYKQAAEAAALHEEAVALCNKVVGLPFESQSPAMNVDYWTKVARAARELHKPEAKA